MKSDKWIDREEWRIERGEWSSIADSKDYGDKIQYIDSVVEV